VEEAAARQSVQTWPRYDLQLQLHKVRAEHAQRAFKLERDLGLERWSAAKRYIAAHERQRKLEWDGKNLELAAELSRTWPRNN
jgi:hypothetical protein